MKRAVLLLALLLAMPATSQASWYYVVCKGTDLNLKTRDEVRERFGRRISSGIKDGRPSDEVRYHGKPFQESFNPEGKGRAMLMVMTFGLCEVVLIPHDLVRIGRTVVIGHKVRWYYDEANKVTSCVIDGKEPEHLPIDPTFDPLVPPK